MDLLICGTAAAEAWPGLFCTCHACREAARRGGKNLRSRAAYMLGERIRIDFGPDTHLHQQRYGLQLDRLEHLLVTHSHSDHWYPVELSWRRRGYSVAPDRVLRVWGNEAVGRSLKEAVGEDLENLKLDFALLRPWEEADLGAARALAIPAMHDPSEECLNFVIETDGRRFLLAHDTGWYPDETWRRIAERPLDLALIDCTYGSQDAIRGHMGCAGVVRARAELDRLGGLAPGARVVATHFSHNGGWLHEELIAYFAPHGIDVAFDGMRLPL